MTADETADAMEIVNPLIFQCKACRQVLGDSFAWLCADQQLNAITIRACVQTRIDAALQFSSQDNMDAGCAYHTLLCMKCGAIVGRQYITTTPAYDQVRNFYTFDLKAITSYQLGMDQTQEADVNLEDMVTLPTAMEYRTTMARIQQVLMHMDDRMVKVEDKLQRMIQSARTKKQKSSPDAVVE